MPANTFVASFIGSPAMNLMQGEISGGTFTGKNVRIEGLSAPDGPVQLGFRAEDAGCRQRGQRQITVPLYTIELLGDATMLTARAGGALVSVKAGKEFRAEIGDTVSFSIPPASATCFTTKRGRGSGADPRPVHQPGCRTSKLHPTTDRENCNEPQTDPHGRRDQRRGASRRGRLRL